MFTLPQQTLPAVAARDGRGRAGGAGAAAGRRRRRAAPVLDTGTLTVLDNQVDPATGTIKLKAASPTQRLALWPGAFVTRPAAGGNRCTTPSWCRRSAVQRGPQGPYVYVVNDGQTVDRRAGHGRPRGPARPRSSPTGLRRGEQVVVDGASRLTDGAKVTVGRTRRPGRGRPPARRHRGRRPDGAAGTRPTAAGVNISAPFIARPIATSLLAIAVLLAGVLGYRALPVSALPQVDFPTIQVTTQLPGASPDTVATLITASLERQFGQIQGLTTMTSPAPRAPARSPCNSRSSRSIDSAAQDVQAAINAAAGTLPATLPYPPVYAKVNPADAPILTLALTSRRGHRSTASATPPTRCCSRSSAEIDGVGRVTVQGNMRPAVRVRVDPARLAAYGLAMEDVRTAVAAANVNGAKGGFDGPRQAFALGANDQLVDADAYTDLVIAWRNGAPVRLSDVGTRGRRGGERPRRRLVLPDGGSAGRSVLSTSSASPAPTSCRPWTG